MATVSQQRLYDLQRYLCGIEPGGDYWIDAEEKFNLRKVSVTDLVAHGVAEEQAKAAVAGLRQRDVSGLADALGVRFRLKFKTWIERDGSRFRIKVGDAENTDWLRQYVSSTVANVRVSEASRDADGRYYRFTVTCDDDAGPWRLERALKDCPATIPRRMPIVRIVERPHYRLAARELATWIDRQEQDVWWSVDGDPLLMGRLDLPCPPEELSAALSSIDKILLVDDPDDVANGETLSAEELDHAVTVNWLGIRRLFLASEHDTEDWLLSEAEELIEGMS